MLPFYGLFVLMHRELRTCEAVKFGDKLTDTVGKSWHYSYLQTRSILITTTPSIYIKRKRVKSEFILCVNLAFIKTH